MKKEKRVHWTQTPKGRRLLAERAKMSPAERIVKRAVGKKASVDRAVLYRKAASVAVLNGESNKLIDTIAHALLLAKMKEMELV